MFRFKPGIRVGYERQGYIYFWSRRYRDKDRAGRKVLDDLCREAAEEHWRALREFVTTDSTATQVCEKYFLSRATLYRCVKRYYEGFPEEL